jgi:hypothetical protein
MNSMVEVASTLTRSEELRRAIAVSSLKERRRIYEGNKTVMAFCQGCLAPLHQTGKLCDECQALAVKGWLDPLQ